MPLRFADQFGNVSVATYDRYDLIPRRMRDPLGNLVTTGDRDAEDRSTSEGIDYRVLKPWLVSDPNRNRAAAAFDALGRVAGTAEMGKPGERLGDSLDGFDPDPSQDTVTAYFADPFEHTRLLLGSATSRVLYDTDAYRRTRSEPSPRPTGSAVLSRETHVSDLASGERTKVQRSFSYSDGFGREVQHKSQAAPGPVVDGGTPVEHRWIGSGWTVYDNKGNRVRTYEPFFTASQEFELARIVGVSSVFFFDPLSRTMATVNPDATYSKTMFDPWQQYAWDVNDTVLLDPREDPDVRGYVGPYLAGLTAAPGGWRPWYAQRVDGALGPHAQAAARKTAPHAGTPALTRSDSLGRTFIAVAHNRVERGGVLADEFYRTRTLLDIQSNTHTILDPLGRSVEEYQYTMASGQAVRSGMDYGGGGMLTDVTGKILYSWSSRGFQTRSEYDALRRPVASYVSGPGIAGDALYQRTVYGESVADPEAANLRTRVVEQYDSAGLNTNVAYDFKGNLLQAQRRLAADYRDVIDWSSPVTLLDPAYPGSTTYDALNRPTSMTSPDGSVVLPSYDAASLLDHIEARLREARGETTTTTIVEHMEHNARGQRILVDHGNGARTTFDYDPMTFRLTQVLTLRSAEPLQELGYVYDPIGNVAFQSDSAQQTVFFRNRVVRPNAAYTYDAIYQLIEATGREHLGQNAAGALRAGPPTSTDAPRVGLPQPGDGTAMARYRQRYAYDEIGNLLRVAHRSADPEYGGWTLEYGYREASLLEPDRFGNRLSRVAPDLRNGPSGGHFSYDEQGNITAMPSIPAMSWDPQDRLHSTARQVTNGEAEPATTYYVYDSQGRRVRKVTERAPGSVGHERIYLGIFELYREYEHDGDVSLERETLHVLDDARRVAMVETRTRGTDKGAARLIRYQHTDQIESSVLELDQHARIITYEQYYPFGGTSYQAVRSAAEAPKRYRFTGRERDSESGLYYHGARYYAPWLGRWTSSDPIGIGDGLNTYAYVHNNPLRMIDPTGHAGEPVQMHFVESKAYEQVARATPSGRGFTDSMYAYYNRVKAAWGETETAYDIGHEAAKPFWSLKAGATARVRLELASWNRSMGAVRDKAAKAVATAAGKWTRTGDDDLSFIGKFKRQFWKPLAGSEPTPIVQKMAASSEWDAVAAAAQRGEQLVLPGVDMAKNVAPASMQLELPFATGLKQAAPIAQEAEQLALPFAKAAEGASAVTKVAQTASTVAKAAVTGEAVARTVGTVARVAKTVAPVARVVAKIAGPVAVLAVTAEVLTANTPAEKANAGVDVVATAVGFAGPLGAAASVAIVAGGAVGGKVADLVEEHGGSKAESVAAGTLAGAATGAAIGAVVGSIVPGVGTVAGAVVGAALGGAAGFVKSYWR
jgi:RHS repeat-associated protein